MHEPWYDIQGDDPIARTLERELRRELHPSHVLAGTTPIAIARRDDRDDVLFDLDDGRFAIVHLTWKRAAETDAHWPVATIFDSRAALDARMEQDAAEFAS